jgi:hypothetical protein
MLWSHAYEVMFSVSLLAQGAHLFNSRGSAVGTVAGLYGPGIVVQFPAGIRDFSLLHNIQTASAVHPTSCKYIRCLIERRKALPLHLSHFI